MFIAKFSQTTGAPFNADKNSNMPYIGEVLAGTATGTIINGTMFERAGLQPNKLYACENDVDPAYPTNVQVKVIAEVSILDYQQLRTKLGAGKTVINAAEQASVNTETGEVVPATPAEAELV